MMMLASGLLALPGSYLCGVIDSKIGARKAAYTSYVFGILAMLLNLTGNTVCVWISLVCIGMVVGGAATGRHHSVLKSLETASQWIWYYPANDSGSRSSWTCILRSILRNDRKL